VIALPSDAVLPDTLAPQFPQLAAASLLESEASTVKATSLATGASGGSGIG